MVPWSVAAIKFVAVENKLETHFNIGYFRSAPLDRCMFQFQWSDQGCPIVAISHQLATEALKYVPYQIQLVLLNTTKSHTAWQAEPFRYCTCYSLYSHVNFMKLLLSSYLSWNLLLI